jgi:hypothetical protein
MLCNREMLTAANLQMYYLPSIPLLALSSMIDERLDDTFGEEAALEWLTCPPTCAPGAF